jgi:hypothetical protein
MIGGLFQSTRPVDMDPNIKSDHNNSPICPTTSNLWMLSEATPFWCVNLGVTNLSREGSINKQREKEISFGSSGLSDSTK